MKALKIFAFAAVAAVMAVSCGRSEVKVDVELPTNAEIDSVSYLLGVNYGLMFKQQGFAENLNELDMALLKKGMEDALKANVDTTASGLQYTILAEGAAEKVAVNDTVTVKYKGTLIDGTVFDEGEIPSHISGSRGLIAGFDEGIRLVGEGGKAILYIPAELAYGVRGNRGIEPNSVLIFDVEVVKVGKFVPQE